MGRPAKPGAYAEATRRALYKLVAGLSRRAAAR
jgi:hypothetical protein